MATLLPGDSSRHDAFRFTIKIYLPSNVFLPPEGRKEMLISYEALIDAISARDRWLAMRAMRSHLLTIQEQLRYGPADVEAGTVMKQASRAVA